MSFSKKDDHFRFHRLDDHQRSVNLSEPRLCRRPSGITLYSHKAPIIPPRSTIHYKSSSNTGAMNPNSSHPIKYAYVLMHDKLGWQSLSNLKVGLREDYMRLSPDSCDVDVPKGTLVEVDPACNFNPQNDISCTVISIDRPEVKVPLLMKELMLIEDEIYDRLLPLTPEQRYSLITDRSRYRILSCREGEMVWVVNSCGTGRPTLGILRYIGSVKGLTKGVWFGVELLDSTQGVSDGMYGGTRYFEAARCSSVFVSAAHLVPHESPGSEDDIVNEFKTACHLVNEEKEHKSKNKGHPESVDHLRIVKGNQREPESRITKNYSANAYTAKVQMSSEVNQHTGQLQSGRINEIDIGDRIVWLSDDGAEIGTVRWIGYLKDQQKEHAGIEFDHPVGNSNGAYDSERLFKTDYPHGAFLPMEDLLKLDDINPVEISKRACKITTPIKAMQQMPHINGFKEEPRGDEQDKTFPRNCEVENNKAFNPKRISLTPTEENYFNENEEEEGSKTSSVSRSQNKNHHHWGWSSLSSKTSPFFGKRSSPLPHRTRFDVLDTQYSIKENDKTDIGTLVELHKDGEPVYGIVRWSGWLPDFDGKCLGIELDDDMPGATNGWHNGTQLFACSEHRAVFVPLNKVRIDERFGKPNSNGTESTLNLAFGDMACPVVPGFHPPIEVSDMKTIIGRNHGIQGHQNSCYLDATLFAMFSFTSVFDSLLYRPHYKEDIEEYGNVQRVLREEIVNPLRKNLYVRADKVMKLRTLLDHLTSVRGLTSEEKDPEEFLNSLLTQTLKAAPFLELSSGQTSHLYQLFVERDESMKMPTVQQIVEQSFITSKVKLSKVPSVLILQMPRFGNQFKVYDRILPSDYLDVTDIIEESPRQCIVCGKAATVECLDCRGDHGSGLDSTVFCKSCLEPVHNHLKRKLHKPKPLKLPEEFMAIGFSSESVPRLYMELFAVVCIETSHYVTFAKCGSGPDASWCFFDSMADRKGEVNGFNIPEVSPAPDVPRLFSDEVGSFLQTFKDDKDLPKQVKRLICDGYMCFYQSPQVMMYR